MAAPVQRRGDGVTAAVVIAGPAIRLKEERVLVRGSDLIAAVAELALLRHVSPLLEAQGRGAWGNKG
jgi:DNA-binding IclR family transcriptional regulator